MSDLISRTYLRNWILDNPFSNIHDFLDIIYDAPTAYDVDKVIEQLEEEAEFSYADFYAYAEKHGIDAEYDDFRFGLRRAIEIVKEGTE